MTMPGMTMPGNPVPVLAIDGPSGSGKGTISRQVAHLLGWHFLDSGALYRMAGLAAQRAGLQDAADARLAAIAANLDARFITSSGGEEQIWLGDENVTDQLRSEESGRLASSIAALPAVRDALLASQRAFRRPPGLVADGRDMGTTVFPDAFLKVYLTANAATRAQRRHKQLKDKGIDVSLARLSRDIEERDRRDSERSVAPLRAAADARLLDSSNQTIEEVTRTVLVWVQECLSSQ